MRAEMFLALLHQVNFAERALVRHFFHFHVFRGEQQLFGIHEQYARFLADVDHLVGFFQRHGQRLLAHHMLARIGDVTRHRAVKMVGRVDGDHLDIFLFEHLAIVVIHVRDAIFFG